MPQALQVLRCYSCEAFQVHIVKKVSKWSCKVCGEKQSLKKVYGQGTGKDCREIVQKLNEQRLTLQQQALENSKVIEQENDVGVANLPLNETKNPQHNKWLEFVIPSTDFETGAKEDDTDSDLRNLTFELPQQKKCAKRKRTNKQLEPHNHLGDTERVIETIKSTGDEVNEKRQFLIDTSTYKKCNKSEHNRNDGSNSTTFKVPAVKSNKWSEFCPETLVGLHKSNCFDEEDEVSHIMKRNCSGNTNFEVRDNKQSKWIEFLCNNEQNSKSADNKRTTFTELIEFDNTENKNDRLNFDDKTQKSSKLRDACEPGEMHETIDSNIPSVHVERISRILKNKEEFKLSGCQENGYRRKNNKMQIVNKSQKVDNLQSNIFGDRTYDLDSILEF